MTHWHRPASSDASVLRRCWVLLTMGDRPDELAAAVESIERHDPLGSILVVGNGASVDPPGRAETLALAENLGVPGGRQAAIDHCVDADLLVFLDVDARVVELDVQAVDAAFRHDPALVAVSFRLVDDTGTSSRRHVPRLGRRGVERSGDVATFLGGASVLRRAAVVAAGGYWSALFYAHEELDLAWRMIERGGRVRYDADAVVFHPATRISRHAEGWRLTGRNRVWVARRNLPLPLAFAHSLAWLALGALRTPDHLTRRAYLDGWRSGWSERITRQPMRWSTVLRLTRLGRPPIV